MNLINKKLLAQKIENFKNFPDGGKLENDKKIVEGWIKSLKQDNLDNTKEKSVEKSFLIRFFADILGYQELGSLSDTSNLYPDYTIEKSAGSDTLYADGALGFFSKDRNVVKAVIELKDALTPLDKKQSGREKGYTPVGQAFQYAQKIDGCNWIIVSNFKEIRLYNKQRSDELYEAINVLELSNPENFKRFYYLLCRENLISEGPKSVMDSVLLQSVENDEDITKKFYAEYKVVRVKFFEHLQKHNPNLDKHALLEKTQKLLDRFIFVLFCEDTNGLLPLNISKQTYELGKKSRERSDEKIWREFRNLFMDIDEGRIDVDPQINKYNGGLFRKDETLDAMSIKDEIWEELMRLTRWDFDSELNVNILGHIFEQSISDLETLRAEISGEQVDKSKSKRKKEGVYYTPEYITKYIVENTVGRWLEENPDKLENVTILDPACGSGAFLNQAHSYLMKQFKLRNDEAMLNSKGKMQLFNYHVAETTILSKNLYGVDLNEESVEITKLSLWLKTATKSEPLQNLDNNIKCGNSLIDDPSVAGQKAFKWEAEFKDVLDAGGFDVVVSNPPYGAYLGEHEKKFFTGNYETAYYKIDSFALFIEKGLKLIKENGFLAVIVPNTCLTIEQHKKLRELLHQYEILEIMDLSYKVFDDADLDTLIMIIKKNRVHREGSIIVKRFSNNFDAHEINRVSFEQSKTIRINLSNAEEILVNKVDNLPKLSDFYFEASQGLTPYDRYQGQDDYTIKNRIYHSNVKINETYKKLINGEDIGRYCIKWNGKDWISYGNWLAAPREEKFFKSPRLLVREITRNGIYSCYTEEEFYNTHVAISIIEKTNSREKLKVLLGIINSKFYNYYHKKCNPKASAKISIPKIFVNDIRNIPIPENCFENIKIANLVDEIIMKTNEYEIFVEDTNNYFYNEFSIKNTSNADIMNKDWDGLKSLLEKNKIRLQHNQKEELMKWFNEKLEKKEQKKLEIENINKQIDHEIYKLYDLTPDEIKIVEDGTV